MQGCRYVPAAVAAPFFLYLDDLVARPRLSSSGATCRVRQLLIGGAIVIASGLYILYRETSSPRAPAGRHRPAAVVSALRGGETPGLRLPSADMKIPHDPPALAALLRRPIPTMSGVQIREGRNPRMPSSASIAGSSGIFPGLGHGRLEKLLRTGQVRIDGKRARAPAIG